MNEQRIPLNHSVLDLQSDGDNAINDWFSFSNSVTTIRICLEDSAHHGLAAALIVHDAQLALTDGDSVHLDARLLEVGGVDIDGREGAAAATDLHIPRMPRGAHTASAAAKANSDLSASARLSLNGDAAVVLAGVAPHPIRARQIESAVRGRQLSDRVIDLAAQTARSEAQPYGVGDLTDPTAVDNVEDAVRRLFRRLRDRFDEAQPHDRRHPPRRR
ncbi:MAG: hypothetical protein OXH13_06635 [Chloroflexi bacterium]|nr:hypothetical protein [Chloroflexota bacterium]MCY3696490.1 hypothetical protein [Chloroflexota bacterium]MXX31481.1 hypothetical protein [Chloroflexota bacterium]MYD16203.1 hypothetical protein [Chloroflexota bacterium]MYJ01772.1 hypothetical protein [Chloroflexota bacterium]